MCLAIPGRVIEIQTCAPQMVVMDFLGVIRDVGTNFVDSVAVGDYLLVHAGCAIAKLAEGIANADNTADYANPEGGETSALWEELINYAASS